jgi:hypothetical protein
MYYMQTPSNGKKLVASFIINVLKIVYSSGSAVAYTFIILTFYESGSDLLPCLLVVTMHVLAYVEI